MMTDTRWLFIL